MLLNGWWIHWQDGAAHAACCVSWSLSECIENAGNTSTDMGRVHHGLPYPALRATPLPLSVSAPSGLHITVDSTDTWDHHTGRGQNMMTRPEEAFQKYSMSLRSLFLLCVDVLTSWPSEQTIMFHIFLLCTRNFIEVRVSFDMHYELLGSESHIDDECQFVSLKSDVLQCFLIPLVELHLCHDVLPENWAHWIWRWVCWFTPHSTMYVCVQTAFSSASLYTWQFNQIDEEL